MNWLFWKGSHSSFLDPCETIEPLLALQADQMASPDEGRRVDAHLRDCVSCRETLTWMSATRKTLASRPVALPPHDLRVRIAAAIAASDGVPAQPVRTFRLRPAYAAAASLTALGVFLIGHSINAPHPSQHLKPQTGQMAFNPPSVAPVQKLPQALKMVHTLKHAVPSTRNDERVAVLPEEVSTPSANSRVKPILRIISQPTDQSHSLKAVLTDLHSPSTHPQKQSVIVVAMRPKAVNAITSAPSLSALAPKTHSTAVASASVEPTVTIGTPKIVPVEPAPSISMASSTNHSEAHIQPASLLGSVQEYAQKHQSTLERSLSLASNKAIRGAVYRTAMTSGLETPVSFADIHSP